MAPPQLSDKHILVLLTAFGLAGTEFLVHLRELSKITGESVGELIGLLETLARTGWIAASNTPATFWFTDKQAEAINLHYPNCLDT